MLWFWTLVCLIAIFTNLLNNFPSNAIVAHSQGLVCSPADLSRFAQNKFDIYSQV